MADFAEDPFKDYRYEDVFNIEDPFADEIAPGADQLDKNSMDNIFSSSQPFGGRFLFISFSSHFLF